MNSCRIAAGVSVVARGLRAENAEVDRNQDGAEAIIGLDVMCFGQADQAADFLTKIFANVLFGQSGTELFIVRAGRVVDDIVPPDRLGQDFALEPPRDFPRARAQRDSRRYARDCDSGGQGPCRRRSTLRGSSARCPPFRSAVGRISDSVIRHSSRIDRGGLRLRLTHPTTPYRIVIARPLRSAFAINPTWWPVNSSTAPFWLVSTIARAPRPTAMPAPAAP